MARRKASQSAAGGDAGMVMLGERTSGLRCFSLREKVVCVSKPDEGRYGWEGIFVFCFWWSAFALRPSPEGRGSCLLTGHALLCGLRSELCRKRFWIEILAGGEFRQLVPW